jgi:ABC-type methionine transport system permease subunit
MYTTIALMVVLVMLIQGGGSLLARLLDKRSR